MTASPLSIHGLTFSYPALQGRSPHAVLDGISFRLPAACRGVILGAADQGKTTLARILAGLVPRFTGGMLQGSMTVAGRDPRETRPFDSVQTIGVVFQDADEQIFTTRCDTEVAFAMESLGIPLAAMQQRVAESLALVGLSDFTSRNPATLSGGEKKRLLIACLAAVDPDLWILDEVFQELDHTWRTALLELLVTKSKPALFFDSRWTPLYATGFSDLSVLSACRLAAVSRGGAAPDMELLCREGICLPDSAGSGRPLDGAWEPLLRVDGLSYQFPGKGSFSLNVGSLELRSGEVCALVGRNGSGKSTLGKALCGLLVPQAGTISLRAGREFRRASPAELNRSVGYMFQNPDYQIFLPTVFEELALGLRAAGIAQDVIRGRVEEAQRLFHLPPGDMPPALMSYGARKRLQAATYNLLGRRLLILDEIDSGLSYREFMSLISALVSSGSGLLLITHDAALARAIAHRVIVIDEGRIVRDSPAELFASSPGMPGESR